MTILTDAFVWVIVDTKKLNHTLAIGLTFSNIDFIYRLALPLLSPETLSSLSKSRIFLYNAHLALFVRMDDTDIPIQYIYIFIYGH